MKIILQTAFACALAIIATAVVTAETKLAVIGGVDSGLNDLLTVQLSEAEGITVLERQELDAVIDEKTVQGLMKAEAGRNRITAITGADFLVLLSRDKERVRLVVAETNFGVTLQSLSIPTQGKPTEKTVAALREEVKNVVAEFSQGVQQIVAVPDFVSRDLIHDYDFLQTDYAEVIRAGFRQIPGLALVAVDEATAIANERDISGIEQKDRLVPVFIDGEYRTTHDPKSKATTVLITVRAKNSAGVLVERELPAVPMEQAGKRLLEVFSKNLHTLIKAGSESIDIEGQHKLLTERAKKFSDIGEIRRSAALREAALLLKPDDADQRIQLVREYRLLSRKVSKSALTQTLNQFGINWKRSIRHCEYLIHNRQLSGEVAWKLSAEVVGSIRSIRKRLPVAEYEEIRRQFLRHTFPQIISLGWRSNTDSEHERTKNFGAIQVCQSACGLALSDPMFFPASSEDLNLLADLIVTELPEAFIRPRTNFLQLAGVGLQKNDRRLLFSQEQYDAFLKRLIESDRPKIQLFGRYGKLRCRPLDEHEDSGKWMTEAKDLIAAARAAGFEKKHRSFYYALVSEPFHIAGDVPPPPKITNPNPEKVPPKRPAPTVARLTMEPIELTIDTASSDNKTLAWTSFRSLSDGLDAFWSKTALMFSHQPGKLIQVLNDPKLLIESVVYDGQYVWVANQTKPEILLIDIDGKELARIDKDLGLPPCDKKYRRDQLRWGLVIHPLGPGRLLASGSFGPKSRAWIAEIKFDGQSAKINVFHEAIKVWESIKGNPGYRHNNTDPEVGFKPRNMIEHIIPGDKPRRLVFISKYRGSNPIIVDAETLNVWCCQPTKSKVPPQLRPEAVMNIDGLLYVPGYATFQTFRYNDKSGRLDVVRERPRMIPGVDRPSFSSLARDGDWLYYTGTFYWQRFNLRTGVEELLNDDEAALPKFVKYHGYIQDKYGRRPNPPPWKVFNSSHYGLVAEREGKLYRVHVKPPEEDAYAKPTEK